MDALASLGRHEHRPSDGEDEQRVVAYACKALDALGVKFGPTHTGATLASVAAWHMVLIFSTCVVKRQSVSDALYWGHVLTFVKFLLGEDECEVFALLHGETSIVVQQFVMCVHPA